MEITKILQMLEYAVILVPALLVLIGVFIFSKNTHMKIKGKQIVRRLFSRTLLVLFLIVVLSVTYVGTSFIQSRLSGNVTISFNYAEASRGLNPNSTRFNTYDMIDDEVLERAIQLGGFTDLSVSDLRAALSVVPVETGSTISVDQYYVSAEYELQYRATKKMLRITANRVLTAVSTAYYEKFCENYLRKTNILELDFSELDASDYLDKVDLLGMYVSNIADYLQMCNAESETYANADGETFATLAAKVRNLGTVELEKIRSFILTKGLSANARQQVSRLEYENLIKDINYEKNYANYEVNLEVIRMYERDMATIVLVPTRDETGEFYMGRTKVNVDNFANSAQQSSARAAQTGEFISSNKYAIEKISQSEASGEDYSVAYAMIESLKENLNSFAEKAKFMVEDYDARAKKASVTFCLADLEWLNRSFVIKTVIIGLYIVICSILFAVCLNDKRKYSAPPRHDQNDHIVKI